MDVPIPSLPAAPVLAGLEPTATVNAACADVCPDLRLVPDLVLPKRDGMLRVETASGQPLNRRGTLAAYWHRPPYTLTLRLVRYAPGSALPEVVDQAVIGTRGERAAFYRHAECTALRLVSDALQGRSRGGSDESAMPLPDGGGVPGWIDRMRSRWSERLLSEWWSLGFSATPLSEIIESGQLGATTWLRPGKGPSYLADPFPWPGTDQILCEEMPMSGGHGRIVAISDDHGSHQTGPYQTSQTILDDGYHHSYPCTFQEAGTTWFLPESTERGATMLYRLGANGDIDPVCAIAPERRLSDPTLFRHDGRYWIACADLDIGAHDSLCLLHATSLDGSWQPHRLDPVRIDIRGARPAGALFRVRNTLYRPGQNCAATYGAGITIYRIDVLTPDDYHETAVAALNPDRNGPFPHGLHTLVSDGARTWVDGKRFVFDGTALMHKAGRRIRSILNRQFTTVSQAESPA